MISQVLLLNDERFSFDLPLTYLQALTSINNFTKTHQWCYGYRWNQASCLLFLNSHPYSANIFFHSNYLFFNIFQKLLMRLIMGFFWEKVFSETRAAFSVLFDAVDYVVIQEKHSSLVESRGKSLDVLALSLWFLPYHKESLWRKCWSFSGGQTSKKGLIKISIFWILLPTWHEIPIQIV